MTEESDDGYSEVKQHKLLWRSESMLSLLSIIITSIIWLLLYFLLELNRLISKVDSKHQKSNKGSYKFKPRVISTPSQGIPPTNAPKWTIDKNYQFPPEHEDVASDHEAVPTEVLPSVSTGLLLDSSLMTTSDEGSDSE